MTDRIHSLTVVLERDNRDDDVEILANAIRLFRGVLSVDLNVSDPGVHIAQVRARHALREQIADVLWPKPKVEE